jgi:Na+-transporting NADH:ubiquinone oxidoreductase subunit NqrD
MKQVTPFASRAVIAMAVLLICSGCAVVAVADAVVTTAAVIVKTGVKVTGAVINAVIPDSKDDK